MEVKKILSMILVGAAAMSLMAGCGSDQESGQEGTAQNESQAETTQDNASDNTESTGDTASGNGNVLVVYYSATGNTEEAANIIADTT